MKYGLLVWNILLTLVAGYLFIVHFTSNKDKNSSGKSVKEDSLDVNREFRIAYFEMDSVEANFSMVKDVKAEMNKKETAINNELDDLSRKFRTKYDYYQGQAEAGKMTQTESEKASIELKNLDTEIKNRKQVLDQDYNDFVVRQMKDVKTAIEDFLKEYNREKKYSYIVAYEQGLFYYKDSAYDITPDVIKGLNAAYKPKPKPKKS
jgi:outer membrane protein